MGVLLRRLDVYFVQKCTKVLLHDAKQPDELFKFVKNWLEFQKSQRL